MRVGDASEKRKTEGAVEPWVGGGGVLPQQEPTSEREGATQKNDPSLQTPSWS